MATNRSLQVKFNRDGSPVNAAGNCRVDGEIKQITVTNIKGVAPLVGANADGNLGGTYFYEFNALFASDGFTGSVTIILSTGDRITETVS